MSEKEIDLEIYQQIRNDGTVAVYKQERGLLEVFGNEAVQFLNGLITNDVAELEDGEQMSAAFPNAKGRLLAIVRVRRKEDKFLFETEEATHQKVFENLFKFTYAGDFFVEDLSEDYQFFTVFGDTETIDAEGVIRFQNDCFIPKDSAEEFDVLEVSDALYETLRIENGVPKYDFDMDETTVVPEVGLEDLISYNKGCYIGQEVIARIHFRGKVAKQLKGLIFEDEKPKIQPKDEIKSLENKNAGFVTSVTHSPKLEKTIALAYIRNAFLEEGTKLKVGEFLAKVKNLPFVEN